MKYLDEYRDPIAIRNYADEIFRLTNGKWTIMEVCGGQTHSILKNGIDQLLPEGLILLHGPGCPVCVTPVELIDKAMNIALLPEVIFCSFGDMLRVPGSIGDLLSVKARGGDIRVVYSPLDSVELARANPDKEIVFFAVGFETTAPANAMAIKIASERRLANFSVLSAQVLVVPAIEMLLASQGCRIDALLAPGHVCTITGYEEYEKLALRYRVPIVVTGFEPMDIMQGIYMAVSQLENRKSEVGNQYARSVRREGNREARKLINEVFAVVTRKWRGLGEIPCSGLGVATAYSEFDVENRFQMPDTKSAEATDCISGLILQGIRKPVECPVFGNQCTPEHPFGATMVSSEGACAAYYYYRRSEARNQKLTQR